MTRTIQLVEREATARDLPAVRHLLERYAAEVAASGEYPFPHGIENLPGRYVDAAGGALLVCAFQSWVLGCAALARLDEEACEFRRFYMSPEARGLHGGHRLLARALREARRLGYRRVHAETLPERRASLHLMRAYGFRPCAAYREGLVGPTFLERAV